MPVYEVTLMDTNTGEHKQLDYVVQWDSVKVSVDEVGRACAAEFTYRGGKGQNGYKTPFIPVSVQLAEITD